MIDTQQRRAADRWFLEQGLPAVVRPSALVRRLVPRAAPVFAAFAVFMANSALVVSVTGKHTIDINGEPTRTEWFVLALVILVLPVAAIVGWLVSRIDDTGYRTSVAAVAVVVAVLGGVVGGPSPRVFVDLIFEGVVFAIILALTASGVGSILGWTLRMTMEHLAAAGSLLLRALPVVMLTFLVFFNSPVWLMASTVSRVRLWLAILLLAALAAAFVVSVTIDRFRPTINAPEQIADRDARLAGTPFESMPDPATPMKAYPLRRTEQLNVMFVLAASQLAHIMVVAVVTALIFFVLGLILLSPELLAARTRNGASDGTFLGMTVPVPESLIQISMFLGALTFMYVSARAAGDSDYRSQFLDPVVDELRLTLEARARYRNAVAYS
jgi:hypothetical protein